MYTRVTTYEGAPDRIDRLADFARDEVSPVIDGIPDSLGVELLVDRDRGKAVAISTYRTEEGRTAADAALAPIRERSAALIEGTGRTEHLDVALRESRRPNRPGHYVRVTRLQGAPDAVDRTLDYAREVALPGILATPGFGSGVVLVNRSEGVGMMATAWDDRGSLEASRPMADQLRAGSVDRTGAEMVSVEEFEIAYSGMRSPSAHEETIRRMYAAMSAGGNLDELDEFIAPDMIEHGSTPPGLAGLKSMMREYRTAFPDMKVHIDQFLDHGDRSAVSAHVTGTNAGPFQGMPATGRRIEMQIMDLVRFADGKCVEHWGVSDDLNMLRQLGLSEAPGARPAARASRQPRS